MAENLPTSSYYDYQFSKARQKFGDQVLIKVQLLLLSRETGSVSSGNFPTFDVIGSKAREIYCYQWKRGKLPWQHREYKSKTSSPKLRRTLLN